MLKHQTVSLVVFVQPTSVNLSFRLPRRIHCVLLRLTLEPACLQNIFDCFDCNNLKRIHHLWPKWRRLHVEYFISLFILDIFIPFISLLFFNIKDYISATNTKQIQNRNWTSLSYASIHAASFWDPTVIFNSKYRFRV